MNVSSSSSPNTSSPFPPSPPAAPSGSILVFGGTTEGRVAAGVLDAAGRPFFYSTRHDLQEVPMANGTHLCGAMDATAVAQFCRREGVSLLIDAAHPFAPQVHDQIWEGAREAGAKVVRFDRQYAPRETDIVWCADFADFRRRFRRDYPAGARLLAATGVQTIGEYRGLQADIHFRVLNRPQSVALARAQGVEPHRLVFYGQPDPHRYDVLVTKESGRSGGFDEKVAAAREVGTRVYAICRPPLKPERYAAVVDGPNGLRRAVERLLPDFFERHTGLTTGTCATAAAVGAFVHTPGGLLRVELPSGEHIEVETQAARPCADAPDEWECMVRKQAGDDPDVTDGLEIFARVKRDSSGCIHIDGGQGIGTVTLPGLGLPVGSKAVNEAPRRMIDTNLRPLLAAGEGCHVVISAPAGEALAARTFNPRLGIVGGISIIGTSGIVRPYSEEAFLESMRKCIEVAAATGRDALVLNSGARSERPIALHFQQDILPADERPFAGLPRQAFVQYGNAIGQALRMADEVGISRVCLCLMLGKAVKLAAGQLNTHSRVATMDTDFVRDMLAEAACSPVSLQRAAGLTLARELWTLLPPAEADALARVVIRHCYRHCAPLLPRGHLLILLVDEQGAVHRGG